MNDESPKSKRKRRRSIIAGVLLLVVAVTGWWFWPRVDQRFVGRWRYSFEGDHRYWIFRGDGTGESWSHYAGREPFEPNQWHWYFDGSAIVTRPPHFGWTDHIPLPILFPLHRLTNYELAEHESFDLITVHSIEPNLLRAEVPYVDDVQSLDRIPD